MSELNIKKLEEIYDMTLTEFNYRMIALSYEKLNREYELAKFGFYVRDAGLVENTGTEKKPKEEYIFQTANDMLDYTGRLDALEKGIEYKEKPYEKKPKQRLQELAELANTTMAINKESQTE